MANSDLYFLRLDVHQAAIVVGIVQAFMTTLFVLRWELDDTENDFKKTLVRTLIWLLSTMVPVLLTIGAEKGKRWLMLPWLIFSYPGIPLTIIDSIILQYRHFTHESALHIYALLFDVLVIGVWIYCLLVVTKSFNALTLASWKNVGII